MLYKYAIHIYTQSYVYPTKFSIIYETTFDSKVTFCLM